MLALSSLLRPQSPILAYSLHTNEAEGKTHSRASYLGHTTVETEHAFAKHLPCICSGRECCNSCCSLNDADISSRNNMRKNLGSKRLQGR